MRREESSNIMRCGQLRKYTNNLGLRQGFRWMGNELNSKLRKWESRHHGRHERQRSVDTNGKMLGVVSEMSWLHHRRSWRGNC